MSRRKLKKPASKSARRVNARKSKAPFITRAEARRLAARHVLNRIFKGAAVRDGVESCAKIYNVRQEDTWVVYKNSDDIAFKSSAVVIMCKRTGRVLYEGSANDEG